MALAGGGVPHLENTAGASTQGPGENQVAGESAAQVRGREDGRRSGPVESRQKCLYLQASQVCPVDFLARFLCSPRELH